MLDRVDGYYKPEGLPLYLWCVQSLSTAIPTPLTERSMVARVHRSWLMCIIGVVDRPLEDGQRGLFGELSAAEMVHERFRDAAPVLVGHAERPWAVRTWICDARGGARACTSKTPTRCVNYYRGVW